MSMYGMTIRPRMMKLGSTTPACHGSKNTSISCKPRKYQGAFDGFGVRVGLAGSSSGASTSSDHTTSSMIMKSAQRNSERTRCGQVWILSSVGLTVGRAAVCARPPGGGATGFTCTSAIALVLRSRARRPIEDGEQPHEDHRQHEHAQPREQRGGDDEDDHQHQAADGVLGIR